MSHSWRKPYDASCSIHGNPACFGAVRMDILPQLLVNGIIAGSIYALVALGFTLIYRVTKFFNVAHGALTTVGGYGAFVVTKQLGMPLIVGVVVGSLIAGGLGIVSDRLVYAPLRRRKAKHSVFLVASLGVFTVVQAVIAILFTNQFQTISMNLATGRVYRFLTTVMTQTQIVILMSAIIATLSLIALLKYTSFGERVRAVSDDEEVSRVVGIPIERVIGKAFLLGSLLAGYAGILVGLDMGIEPTMGLNLLLKGVIAAIIGGMGSIPGAFFGAFLLGIIENFGIWKISGEWKDAIAFIVLILFLVFRPRGIFKSA